MAAEGEVPVYDVLNEAMEYLCKLGSNLRVRSETLKNKKIRREKLRNSHAVQKAANKVLLICELSKKSLQNVETGVKKVLSLVEQAQKSSGGNFTSSPRKNYEYFEYESKRLRIAKKVPLKHYMSMKVLARSMPSALLEKYPVYYDCKLYRLRRRANILQRQTEEEMEIKSVNVCKGDIESECVLKADGGKKSDTECEMNSVVEIKNKSREKLNRNESEHQENSCENTKESKIISKESVMSDPTREYYSKKKKLVLPDDETSQLSDRKGKNIPSDEDSHKSERRKSVPSDNELTHESPRKSNEKNEQRRSSGSHKKKRRILDNSSSDEESYKFKSRRSSKNEQMHSLNENNSDDSESNKDKDKFKKRKKIRVVDENSSEDDSHNTKTELQKLDDTFRENDSKEEKPDKERNLETSEGNDKENNHGEIKSQGATLEPNKPLIKCVNLSKLLKPSLIEKVVKKNLEDQKKLSKKNQRTGMTEEESKKDRAKKALEKKKLDEEYWEEKRKEVNAFKPQKFVINVTRLPKLTENFLVKHNLNKITQSGSVVCEKLKSALEKLASEMLDDGGVDSDGLDKRKIIECNINKVKNALLYDSDSDDVEPKKLDATSESDKVKNALLQESDSDKNENSPKKTNDDNHSTDKQKLSRQGSPIENMEEVTNDDNHSTDKQRLSQQRSPIENIDEVTKKTKNALLSSSDSDNAAGDTMRDANERSPGNSPAHNDKTQEDTAINEVQGPDNVEENQQEPDNMEENEQDNNDKTEKKSVYNEKKDHDSSDNKHTTNQDPTDNGNTAKDAAHNDEYDQNQDNNGKAEQDSINYDIHERDPANGDTDQNKTNKDNVEQDQSVEKEDEESDHQNKNEKSSKQNEKSHSQKENEKSVKQAEAKNNPEEVKSSLLNSSDDNTQKTPSNKKRRDSHGTTPRSKRKHIMESMHAKKMLLTYSSSSETEDEQLRSVLKEIKDDLLKGISSDDEKKVQRENMSHRRKLVMSSDSEDDSKKSKESSPKPESADKKSGDEKTDKSGSESTTKTKKNTDADSDKSNSSRSKIGRTKTNSSSSGSSKSDSPDSDKDINGLTNLRTLNKIRRRRGSTSTASKSSRSLGSRKKMPKSPLISAENMLQAESSSEGGSGAESEAGEDLPPVSLAVAPINGGLGDLTKEELLGESDSSSSKNDSDGKESGGNVKSKRRKANAISSDSEAGSSRRKDAIVKLSDFEDSEDESSEPAKKSKRKKVVDSDASAGSSDDGKKKRRRIKQVDSEGSGSDTENEGRNKHGRKNIRKVMGKNQLEEATKKAAREEKERIARIAERQKLYNNLEFDESGKPDEVVLEKVVLDFDPETKEPLIQVDRGLVKKLKPHQANGIKFMWDACFESVKRIKKDKGSGCILAHCMGLGKTLQVVSLTHTLLTHGDLTGVNRVLVVCPLSTVLNWVNEFKMWLKHAETEYEVDVYELSRYKQNSERAFQLQQWFEHGGVCVLGYEMFRNLSADNTKKFKKKMLRNFQESLVDPGPDLVVCDEGHLLKNEKTSLSQSMNRVKTRRRIVLTGTPLQNNLKEYYCMVQFVKPNLLGKYNEYLNRFVNPITNGQYTDSTEHDIRVMKRRSHVLHKMLDGAVQRRDYGVLAPFLPPKHEYVLFITLTELQIKLYQYYLDNYSRRPLPGKSSGFLFPDFQSLQRIWTHPLVLKYNSERYEIMQQKKREREEEEDSEGSLADFIDDDSTPDESTTEESSDDSSGLSDDSRKKNKKKKSPKKSKAKDGKASTRRGTRANPVELEEEDKNDVLEVKHENPTEWWIKLVTEDELEDMRNSSKLLLLFDILRQCEAIGDKLLVFSQSLYSLDLIEHFLGKVDEATQEGRIDEKLGGHVGSWSPGIDYFRLDGSTSCENRSIWCKNFNREDNPRARLFLISTRAGGLGINLVAANRVVIFDVSWNPSHDVQSIFRVYRFGQKKPCYIYRFLAMGTMEEKIYERQVTKQAISKRVIDEQQIDRHYAENDLAELYKFEAHPPTPRPIPPLPKDRLFAEMLREHEAQIYKYHEHDSLLENKEEETLSEEERKAAWEDFENEKNRPPPQPAPMAWPGMVPGILQQQQLAYAALAAMLRKDMPNINDQQIRDMLPLIYNANPGMFGGYDYGLMQKMGEIYKYAQPGMMNPGMMNPLMAGAGGGGMGGGTSGLQYEPPWQRQQQQQQQMRLQQILQQQQNQMGAKYYAGGLGSRDPVAMALQQQRAREIMVGGERGRPRGRPPLQPRPAPRQAPGDVVNLDSD